MIQLGCSANTILGSPLTEMLETPGIGNYHKHRTKHLVTERYKQAFTDIREKVGRAEAGGVSERYPLNFGIAKIIFVCVRDDDS